MRNNNQSVIFVGLSHARNTLFLWLTLMFSPLSLVLLCIHTFPKMTRLMMFVVVVVVDEYEVCGVGI